MLRVWEAALANNDFVYGELEVKNSKGFIGILGGAALLVPVAVLAGEYIAGTGATRAAAAANAEARAAQRARASKTCYRLADYSQCTKSDGEWTCHSEVTHHTHTSNGGVCPN